MRNQRIEGTGLGLLLVDIQQGFDDPSYWGRERNNPEAEANCRRILNRFRELDLPRFHIRHDSTLPGSPLHPLREGNAIKAVVKPEPPEQVIRKSVNSAFIGTGLKELLESLQVTELVITGLTTDHCISSTARMSANLGFRTTVISDATATFNRTGTEGEEYSAELIHRTALASLRDEFAAIADTETFLQKIISGGT